MTDSDAADSREIKLQGIGVSPGVAVGKVFLLKTVEDRIVERELTEEEIPREVTRLEEALIETRHQIHAIQEQVGKAIGQESASIFDAHLLVVDDRAFVEEVIRALHTDHKNVETILRTVADRYADALARVDDDYLRERAVDVRDVTRRILRNLSGKSSDDLAQMDEQCILIANDLAPSETATLDKDKVIAFATDLGSPTSHTAIMSRALQIPAIVGLHDVSVRVSHGDTVLMDGNKGVLIVHPSEELLARYGEIAETRETLRSGLNVLKDEPAETLDGYQIQLSANIELPEDVDAVLESGAVGVGLYRTEYLYLTRNGLPTEEEQVAAYETVAQRLAPAPVIIRTLDLGGDKFVSHLKIPDELNPFMGWRAIRFCLAQPEFFKAQLRAILRASRFKNVKIMYPLVSNLGEVLKANELLEEAKEELRQQNAEFDEDIEVGVMIEVPSAALTAHLMAPHVSFFSIGTNDLVQYTLAVDRVNERIAELYEPTHPAIIKLIKNTVDVAHDNNIWVGICGEMAGNPLMAPLLLGLGVDELSVAPSSVPLVKDALRKLRYAGAQSLAEEALNSQSAADILQHCRKLTQEVAPEILELVE